MATQRANWQVGTTNGAYGMQPSLRALFSLHAPSSRFVTWAYMQQRGCRNREPSNATTVSGNTDTQRTARCSWPASTRAYQVCHAQWRRHKEDGHSCMHRQARASAVEWSKPTRVASPVQHNQHRHKHAPMHPHPPGSETKEPQRTTGGYVPCAQCTASATTCFVPAACEVAAGAATGFGPATSNARARAGANGRAMPTAVAHTAQATQVTTHA